MAEKKRCAANVYAPQMFHGVRKCRRAATVGDYCSQHDPEAVKARAEQTKATLLKRNAYQAKVRHFLARERQSQEAPPA